MTLSAVHSVSVAGIVFDETDRVLLIKRRDNGFWQPPGGVLELGESFEAGVVREVLEETGVSVEVERLTGVYKNLPDAVVALVYRCRAVGGSPEATTESSAAVWLEISEAAARMTESFSIRVTDANRDPKLGPASRIHDGTRLISNL